MPCLRPGIASDAAIEYPLPQLWRTFERVGAWVSYILLGPVCEGTTMRYRTFGKTGWEVSASNPNSSMNSTPKPKNRDLRIGRLY